MKTTEDYSWEQSLRFRLEDFQATVVPVLGVPWSLKIRSIDWRFDRECESQAFVEIDTWMRSHPYVKVWVMDHSTGPEIICYVNPVDEERCMDPFVLELVSVILHSAHKNRGHRASRNRRLEIVTRGFADRERYEETMVCTGTLGSDELGVENLLAKFETAGVVFRTRREIQQVFEESA